MKKTLTIITFLVLVGCTYNSKDSQYVFGKKCAYVDDKVIRSNVWLVEKNTDWQKNINKANCLEQEIKMLEAK